MSFEKLMGAIQRLSASSEALAGLGGELRLRQSGEEGDPGTRELLQDVLRGIDPALLDNVSPEQEAIALAIIRSGRHYAADILDNPARKPGWLHQDMELLQTVGKQSRRIVHQVNTFAAKNTAFHRTLTSPGLFLDIGTGVGWLAIEAAQFWPELKIVGIDIWETALQLARGNIAASGMENRIALRRQNIVDLDDIRAFSVIFLPAPFLPFDVAVTAMDKAYRALAPGGWLAFGIVAPQPDPAGEALAALGSCATVATRGRRSRARTGYASLGLNKSKYLRREQRQHTCTHANRCDRLKAFCPLIEAGQIGSWFSSVQSHKRTLKGVGLMSAKCHSLQLCRNAEMV